MKKLLNLSMLFVMAFFSLNAFACTKEIPAYAEEMFFKNLTAEQKAAAKWVHENAVVCLKPKAVADIVRLTYENAKATDIDPHLALGIMKIESGFNTNAVSYANARGLMQVITKWHPEKVSSRNIHNQAVGIEVGLRVYRDYLDKSRGNHYRAMQLYSGGAGISYYRNAVAAKKSLQKSMFAQLFAGGPTHVREQMVAGL